NGGNGLAFFSCMFSSLSLSLYFSLSLSLSLFLSLSHTHTHSHDSVLSAVWADNRVQCVSAAQRATSEQCLFVLVLLVLMRQMRASSHQSTWMHSGSICVYKHRNVSRT